jgi:hypothetical protein
MVPCPEDCPTSRSFIASRAARPGSRPRRASMLSAWGGSSGARVRERREGATGAPPRRDRNPGKAPRGWPRRRPAHARSRRPPHSRHTYAHRFRGRVRASSRANRRSRALVHRVSRCVPNPVKAVARRRKTPGGFLMRLPSGGDRAREPWAWSCRKVGRARCRWASAPDAPPSKAQGRHDENSTIPSPPGPGVAASRMIRNLGEPAT